MVFRMCQRVCGSWSSVHLGNSPAPYPRPRLSSRRQSAGGKNAAVDHQILVSRSAVSALNIRSHMPACHQRLKRQCTVFRLRYRSGRSRSGTAERNTHRHPITTGGYPHPSDRDQPPYPEPAPQSATIAPRSTRTALSPSPTSHLDRDAYETALTSFGDQVLSGLVRSDRKWRCKEGPAESLRG